MLCCGLQENARHRLLCESLVDEARGIVIPHQDRAEAGPSAGSSAGNDPGNAGTAGSAGNAGEGTEDVARDSAVVLSALRLEQMSKAVRAIVHDLQHSVVQQRPQEHREGPLPGPSPSLAAQQPAGGWPRDASRDQQPPQQLAAAGE